MRRNHHFVIVLLAAGLLALSASGPARAEANINFFLGSKSLDQDDWGTFDQQGAFGIQTTFGPNDWPIGIAIDAYGSADSENIFVVGDVRADLVQATGGLNVGVRKIWKPRKARPFVGGGLAFVTADREFLLGALTVSDSDTAPGGWVDGGVFWRLGKRFNIGLEARVTRAEVQIGGADIQAGGFYFGILLGWGWGGDK